MKKLFFLFFVLYSLLGIFYIRNSPPKGDEFHYLLTTISIVNDGDIDLKNNYDNRDYKDFYSGIIDRHSIKVGGKEFLYHGLGIFQLIIAPFYAIGGRFGVTLFLSLLSAYLITQISKYSYIVTKSKQISLFVAISVGLTLPFIEYSFLIFVEMLAALVLTSICLRFADKKANTFWTTFLIGILPFIHLRFLLVSIPLILFYGFKNRKIMYSLFLIALYFAFTYYIFGTFDPTKPTRDALIGMSIKGNIFVNLINVLTDKQYGLIVYSPIYIFAFPGIMAWYRSNKKSLLLVILVVLSYIIPTFMYYDWNGGYAPPVRYLTPILPLVVPAIVFYLNNFKKIYAYLIIVILTILGVCFFVNLFKMPPNYGFVYMDGYSSHPLAFLFSSYYPLKRLSYKSLFWVLIIISTIFSMRALKNQSVFK